LRRALQRGDGDGGIGMTNFRASSYRKRRAAVPGAVRFTLTVREDPCVAMRPQ